MASEREWNETPECPKCQGEGWLWGKELNDPDEATYADAPTRYSCDDPIHGEPTPESEPYTPQHFFGDEPERCEHSWGHPSPRAGYTDQMNPHHGVRCIREREHPGTHLGPLSERPPGSPTLTESLLRVANVDPPPESSVTEHPPVSGVDTTVERLEADLKEAEKGVDFQKSGVVRAIAEKRIRLDRDALTLIHTLQAENERLRGGLSGLVTSVDSLIMESGGVYGLHLNDDDAPWESLTEGGAFEEWLLTLEIARTTLTGE